MFDNIMNFFKKFNKKEEKGIINSRNAAKERLHLVLMQDRANFSVDFLELMKQEIIEVIKKYIDVDENAIDVRLTNKENVDGTNGAPALYANIPILNLKNEARKVGKFEENPEKKETKKVEKDSSKEENKQDTSIKNIKEDVDIIIDNGEDTKKEETVEENKEKTVEENNKEVKTEVVEEKSEEIKTEEVKEEKEKEEIKSEN